MLYGHFKEAHQGADVPIPLHEITPEVFECALSFLFGQEKNFQNAELAMEVYKFAHEMQINSILHAVNKFFKTIISISEACAVFHFCIQMDNTDGLQIGIELVQGKNSLEAWNSDAWLKVLESVVQEVLQLDQLDMSESDVVAALLKWGRAQVEADGHDPSDSGKLRLKIDSCLKFIRWPQFNNNRFAYGFAKVILVLS